MPDDLLAAASALLPDAVALRRALHRVPEVGLRTPATQRAVLDALDGLGLRIATGDAVTSVTAVLQGGRPGPVVLLRSDMDALPVHEDTGLPFASEREGAMHACGHDAHMAMLLSAARLLRERREEVAGRVVFAFQPGEEGDGGGRIMVEEGVLGAAGDPPLAAFALHVFPNLPSGVAHTRAGPLMASSDVLHAEFAGRGGHGSAPHLALDPVPVAAEAILALQTYSSRRTDPLEPVVIGVSRVASGTTHNVIPETASLLGTLRTLSEETRERVKREAAALLRGIASAHGLSAEAWFDHGYPVTVNDADAAAFALRAAEETLGAGRAVRMAAPVLASEDFSYLLQRVPGAMVFLGVAPDGAAPVPDGGEAPPRASLHSNRMLLDEDAMAAGIALHAALALGTLRRGGPAADASQ
jgi:hippurate hydrolase